MRVTLPYLVQDQLTAAAKGMRPTESFIFDGNEEFLDGPVCRRVAILDFDETNGSLLKPVTFEPPNAQRKLGRYVLPDNLDPSDRDFQRVSVFATILKTIRAFESEDVLGRELTWAFDGPQLLVVPRAGNQANAFYERESRSLQFFYFSSLSQANKTIYTSLSHDIVAHETGHAILDGIAPSLYDAITPQALALHEGIADLTALTMSLESGLLRETVLNQMNGRIEGRSALSGVAEEFGHAMGQGQVYLRSLWNDKTLDPRDRSRDENGQPNLVARHSPHELSQVVSGALFRLLTQLHTSEMHKATAHITDAQERESARFSGSGKALFVAAMKFRRIVFRALDYLPPGEISFADFGRAIIAADRSANPDSSAYRDFVATEFVARHIAASNAELTNSPALVGTQLADANLDTLLNDDWAAYQFVETHRAQLGVPAAIPFKVLPRLATDKLTWRRGDEEKRFRELLLKVEWEREEPNDVRALGSPVRAIRAGLTLVIDREDKTVKALLLTNQDQQQAQDRSQSLRAMVEEELIVTGPASSDVSSGIVARVSDGVLRVQGGARSLHLTATVL